MKFQFQITYFNLYLFEFPLLIYFYFNTTFNVPFVIYIFVIIKWDKEDIRSIFYDTFESVHILYFNILYYIFTMLYLYVNIIFHT